jgi:hypothetical protein
VYTCDLGYILKDEIILKVERNMTIKKIVSGGQTGADQGALDAAIKYGFPHGGWVPKGRLTESGPLPEKYKLKEMPTASYPKRTEQNAKDSDGTVIISRGKLTGGSKATMKFAKKIRKPWFHIDLNEAYVYLVASDIYRWTLENNIRTLNVAGPRASKDPKVNEDVRYIIEGTILLTLVKAKAGQGLTEFTEDELTKNIPAIRKSVVHAVVDELISDIPLDGRVLIANMAEDEIRVLQAVFEAYVRNEFGDNAKIDKVITALWDKLKDTHKLRVVR